MDTNKRGYDSKVDSNAVLTEARKYKILEKRNRIMDRAIEIVDQDEMLGICLHCEEEQMAEPDARRYVCESCGESKVYGAEELLMMLA